MTDRPIGECPRCGGGAFRTGGHTEDVDAEGHWIQTGQCLSCGAQLERDEGIVEWTVAGSQSGEGEAAAESG